MDATVSMILSRKGSNVVTVIAEDSLASVADTLTQHRIGACPVLSRSGEVEGMISERDIVTAIAREGAAALNRPVRDVMARNVLTCSPSDRIGRIMERMTAERVRHLPVVMQGELQGIVSIGDVVKERLEEAELEVDALRTYIGS